VSRRNHLVGAPREPESPALARAARSVMLTDAYELDAGQREMVLRAIVEVCWHRGWTLLAAHVRTAHIHTVVDAEIAPERILNAFKSYSTRALNRDRPWARHGSTLYLWTAEAVGRAVNYVVSKQGEPMAVYYSSPGSFAGGIS
jgi:REP element-mobilizing transposase RayT